MSAITSGCDLALFMFVLGLGLGMVMQVLVLAVQNAVDYPDLGVATSGATLFRSIGGSVGTAILGSIFASGLMTDLKTALVKVGAAGKASQIAHAPPQSLKKLPPPSATCTSTRSRTRSARYSWWPPGSPRSRSRSAGCCRSSRFATA